MIFLSQSKSASSSMNYTFMLTLPLRLQMETPPPPASLNVLDLALKGGPFMIPLLAFSILTVYLMVERYITLNR
ncbi:MAG: hypothetical protein ACKOHH_07070 [Bacteroidota bacterium]